MRIALLAVFLGLGFLSVSAAPATPETFIAAIQQAIAAKSTDQILALTYTAGLSDAEKQQTASIDKMLLFGHPIASMTLGPLPEDFQSVYIANGKKIEPTAKPQGFVQIQFAKVANGPQGASIIYAVIDGSYYLLASKTTGLGWKGPPDNALIFNVMGPGSKDVKVDIKWNASGVEQERTFKTSNSGFMGQYFESVTVTSADPTADLSLELMANGKNIAPPLKGKGTITYTK